MLEEQVERMLSDRAVVRSLITDSRHRHEPDPGHPADVVDLRPDEGGNHPR